VEIAQMRGRLRRILRGGAGSNGEVVEVVDGHE